MKFHSIIACCLCAALGSAYGQSAHAAGVYAQHNLVSDGFIAADHNDPNLVNAWGVAFNPIGFAWVANNGTGTSTLYDGAGNPQSLVVQIPTPTQNSGGNPTGIVFNGSGGFVVSNGTTSGPSRFIFVTEDGVIAGWSPAVDRTHAIVAVDNSTTDAIYKGVALGSGATGQMLYANDFHNGRVDVFDAAFHPVTLGSNAFTDSNLQPGYAPFGIQAIGDTIYVTYAVQDADAEDELHGQGLGVVDAYDANGNLLRRVATHGQLNAPWGVAMAPAGFGEFSNALLIGNFGDGRINAYDPISGERLGNLRGANHKPLAIDGLWGIAFGNGVAGQPVNTLFFAAGPADEAHGLYGRIDAQ